MSGHDWRGQVVVVTGGGHGIGRAIATRLAAEGARVAVNDLDAEAASRVAAEIGGLPVAGDAASESGVRSLVDEVRSEFDHIDVWCANAGVERGLGLDATEADWALSLEVNVMAHVRAARAVVPQWLERGHGRFVATASAAGLLTLLGNPAYSVSKHGAVAFAEWLAATYRHRGVSVHAICPQGVKTRMYDQAGEFQALLGNDSVLQPEDVASALVEAVDVDRFLVLPHPEVADYYRLRAEDTERWLRGMSRLQQTVEAARDGK